MNGAVTAEQPNLVAPVEGGTDDLLLLLYKLLLERVQVAESVLRQYGELQLRGQEIALQGFSLGDDFALDHASEGEWVCDQEGLVLVDGYLFVEVEVGEGVGQGEEGQEGEG